MNPHDQPSGVVVSLHHRMSYRYGEPARLSPQLIRLRPSPHARTPILSYTLDIEPTSYFINWQQDPFGFHVARIVLTEPTASFVVDVRLVARLTPVNPFDFFLEPGAETMPLDYQDDLAADLAPYLRPADGASDVLCRWLDELRPAGEQDQRSAGDGVSTVGFMTDLAGRTAEALDYEVRYEPGVQSCETTLVRGAGSCRDTAWLLVESLRRLGLAARFVSGYLIQLAPEGPPAGEGEGPAQDATDLHAWAEVFLPGAGWIGLDSTSGLLTGEGHIPLVATPTPTTAAPIAGTASLVPTSFTYHNEVNRLDEP